MLLPTFCEKYEISTNVIHSQAKRKKLFERGALYYDSIKQLRVNEKFFIRRKEFNLRIKMYSQDMYYLLTEHFSESELARQAGVSIPFVNDDLFNRNYNSIVTQDINKSEWKFFRFCRRVHLSLNRKFNTKIDIGYLLDRRIK